MKISKTYRNIIINIILQIVATISGLILPRLIIAAYGSTLNGLISSIGQFLTYASLVEMGIGSAAMITLYIPLCNCDYKSMSKILSSISKKYRTSGIIYTIIVCGIALIYPLMIQGQVNYSYAFSMTIILAMIGIIDYLFIGKYKVLLMADQKYYIVNFVKIIATCILTIVSILLLKYKVSLLIVKGFAVFVHALEAVMIRKYVKEKYPEINFNENVSMRFSQQKSVLIQQICMVITYNTDIIILTIMLPSNSLKEISVYSIYAMVLSFAKNFMSVFYVGLGATFGNIYACNDIKNLKKKFKQYELVYDIFLFFVYSCFIALILPFIKCYAGGIADANYVRIEIAVLFGVIGIVAQIKDSHSTLVHGGCGKYKETEKYSVYEAVSNILVSIVLVNKLGMAGVLLGTLTSHLFMDYGVIKCTYKEIFPETASTTLIRITRNVILFFILGGIEIKMTLMIDTWVEWIIAAISIAIFNGLAVLGINFLFEKKEISGIFQRKCKQSKG